MRTEAIAVLGVWPAPSVVDRVDGVYHGPVQRDPALARNALTSVIKSLWADAASEVRLETALTVGRLQYRDADDALDRLLRLDPDASVRIAALNTLSELGYRRMAEVVQTALEDAETSVRMAGLALIPRLTISAGRQADMLALVLKDGSVEEQQQALDALGAMKDENAAAVLRQQLDALTSGTLLPGVELELGDAIEASGDPDLVRGLEAYRNARPTSDAIAQYSEALAGGDAQQGAMVFYRNQAAQCARCHNAGRGGGDVGPRLDKIGALLSRDQLLRALVNPSARIAPGYGLVTLTFDDGSRVTGTLMEEDDQFVVVKSGESEPVKMAKADIAERQNAPSSMPSMGAILDKRELRDIVEFLAGLQ
jgi:putative heme-binding domain-containing protein